MTCEHWKPIAGFEDRYEVSDMGRIRSLDAVVVQSRHGKPYSIVRRGKILTPGRVRRSSDYGNTRHSDSPRVTALNVQISKGTPRREKKCVLVHRLVLEAFVGPCPDNMECCHNNGDPTDNRLSNLRWDTCASNHADMNKHGTQAYGERIHKAKLNEWQVRIIRRLEQMKCCNKRRIAAWFGVDRRTVQHICFGKTWKHLAMVREVEAEVAA